MLMSLQLHMVRVRHPNKTHSRLDKALVRPVVKLVLAVVGLLVRYEFDSVVSRWLCLHTRYKKNKQRVNRPRKVLFQIRHLYHSMTTFHIVHLINNKSMLTGYARS